MVGTTENIEINLKGKDQLTEKIMYTLHYRTNIWYDYHESENLKFVGETIPINNLTKETGSTFSTIEPDYRKKCQIDFFLLVPLCPT